MTVQGIINILCYYRIHIKTFNVNQDYKWNKIIHSALVKPYVHDISRRERFIVIKMLSYLYQDVTFRNYHYYPWKAWRELKFTRCLVSDLEGAFKHYKVRSSFIHIDVVTARRPTLRKMSSQKKKQWSFIFTFHSSSKYKSVFLLDLKKDIARQAL